MRRAHSPLPPPREPKRDPAYMARDRDDRRPPPPSMPSRRRRSFSPPPRGRSPGPYKRHRREDDYYERHDRYGSPPRRRGHSPDYGRGGYDGPPPPYDDYYGGGGGHHHHHQPPPPPRRGGGGGEGGGPKSFKRFLVEDVPDNVSPGEAQALYEAYLTAHFGDQLRARFEQDKGLEGVRAAFHPAAFEASLARHREDAATTARLLAQEIREGGPPANPASPDFAQGAALEAAVLGAPPADEPPAPAPAEGPPCLWKADRVAADLRAARRLAAALDSQRGLPLADNPLLPAPPAGAEGGGAAGGAEGGVEGDGGQDGGDAAGGEAGAGAAEGGSPAAALEAVLAEIDAEGDAAPEDEEALLARLGQLDLVLSWLWAVHGVDYYGGRELLLEAEYAARAGASRTRRGPRPEEGEEQDEEEAKADRAELAERVDKAWAARAEGPDPLLAGCQREEIERRLEEYIDSQIKQENEKKWGSSFSNKFFLEKRFVVKHILNKHQERLDEQREAIRGELYWAAYEAAHKEQHAASRSAAKQRDAARAAAMAEPAGEGDWQEGGFDDGGYGGGPAGALRAPGRLGPMRGRGGRGPPPGRGLAGAPLMGGLPMVDPGMLMMGGLPGPIILPGPGVMGGLPMAGAPLLLDPGMVGGDMPLFIPAGGGRGMMGSRGGMMGGGRGRGRGGPGGRFGGLSAPPGTKLDGPGHLRHYYDLDAPANNRAVLDYGDL